MDLFKEVRLRFVMKTTVLAKNPSTDMKSVGGFCDAWRWVRGPGIEP
jgi:hypothetical protein